MVSRFAASYVRKRTTERMEDRCRIWKPGPPVTGPDGKATRSVATVKYEGKCRIWEVSSGTQVLIGDEKLTMTQTYLSLPYNSVVPESDDVIKILACDDNDLVGRTVTVLSVVRGGGLRASRKFLVQVVESRKATW